MTFLEPFRRGVTVIAKQRQYVTKETESKNLPCFKIANVAGACAYSDIPLVLRERFQNSHNLRLCIHLTSKIRSTKYIGGGTDNSRYEHISNPE